MSLGQTTTSMYKQLASSQLEHTYLKEHLDVLAMGTANVDDKTKIGSIIKTISICVGYSVLIWNRLITTGISDVPTDTTTFQKD